MGQLLQIQSCKNKINTILLKVTSLWSNHVKRASKSKYKKDYGLFITQ